MVNGLITTGYSSNNLPAAKSILAVFFIDNCSYSIKIPYKEVNTMTIIILFGLIIIFLVCIIFLQASRIQKLEEKNKKKENSFYTINSLLDLYKGNYKEIKTEKEIYFFINNLLGNILLINTKHIIEKEIKNILKRLNVITHYNNEENCFYFFVPQDLQDFIEKHYHAWFTHSEEVLVFRQMIKPIIKAFFYPDEWCIYSTDRIKEYTESQEKPEPAQKSLNE